MRFSVWGVASIILSLVQVRPVPPFPHPQRYTPNLILARKIKVAARSLRARSTQCNKAVMPKASIIVSLRLSLAALEKEAAREGFLLIARKVAAARQ